MLLKDEVLKLRARLKESAGAPLDPSERAHLETLYYQTGEDDETLYEMTGGTRRIGSVNVSYHKLVELFGEPKWTKYTRREIPDIYCEWVVDFVTFDDDGDTDHVIATIYDWRIDADPMENTNWTVGGKDYQADSNVMLVIQGKGKRAPYYG